jgi:hypothetical protein
MGDEREMLSETSLFTINAALGAIAEATAQDGQYFFPAIKLNEYSPEVQTQGRKADLRFHVSADESRIALKNLLRDDRVLVTTYLEVARREIEHQTASLAPEKSEEGSDEPIIITRSKWIEFVRLMRTADDNWEADRRAHVLGKRGICRKIWAYFTFQQKEQPRPIVGRAARNALIKRQR